jgi:hypothetical protein
MKIVLFQKKQAHDPFNSQRGFRDHLTAMNAVGKEIK